MRPERSIVRWPTERDELAIERLRQPTEFRLTGTDPQPERSGPIRPWERSSASHPHVERMRGGGDRGDRTLDGGDVRIERRPDEANGHVKGIEANPANIGRTTARATDWTDDRRPVRGSNSLDERSDALDRIGRQRDGDEQAASRLPQPGEPRRLRCGVMGSDGPSTDRARPVVRHPR